MAMFAHLHSSPLVVRRRHGVEWQSASLSSSGPESALPPASVPALGGGLEPVEIIDVKYERKLLLQCVRESQKKLVWHSQVADLHTFRKVLSYGCRALHFSGHGVPGKVLFESAKGEAQLVSQQELSDLLLAGGAGAGNSSDSEGERSNVQLQELASEPGGWIAVHEPPRVPLQLVFLSACHSESVADAFVRAGVLHVVVVAKEDKVLDKKAMEFAKAFYTALFAGHSVARAFEIGQVQADICVTASDNLSSALASGSRTQRDATFKLLGHGDHSEALFRDVPEGDFVDHSPPLPVNECDAVAEFFVGRSREVHHVYKSLVEGARLVSITGERGIGKTEIALQCAQYATERHLFQHIYFLRLETVNQGSSCSDEAHLLHGNHTGLVPKFAKALGLNGIQDSDELATQLRYKCSPGEAYLLVLDGCNRQTRRDSRFRALLALLLRRVSSLAVVLTGDGKVGAMDGVGEKIVAVDRLPPSEAALLFTLRAPRKIKLHEMGSGNSDLASFGDHPIIRQLRGHPRTICAVAQFLEKKDLELDQHEFLNYIIPSVNAGLCVDNDNHDGFDVKSETSSDHPHHLHPHHHHHHQHEHERDGIPETRRLISTQSDRWNSSSSGATVHHSKLLTSHSESDLLHGINAMSLASSSSSVSLKQLYILKLADHVKLVVPDSDGALVWAHAIVANASDLPESAFATPAVMTRLMGMQSIPLDWMAPQISRCFATKLKQDAVMRPLSLRSIDFFRKSTLVWGAAGRAPAQGSMNGHVDLAMFAAFWRWFQPLTECISFSRLWAFTQPRLLHGFLSKGACVQMLQHAPPGTFLLRFSETRLRCFVIAYVHDDGCVQFVPVTCDPTTGPDGGAGGWCIAVQDEQRGVTFATIQELILSVSVLKFVFPHTPKEMAFQLDVLDQS